jgi:hypothetical protein
MLVLLFMSVCCGSSLLSKETVMRTQLPRIGWGRDADGAPIYSAQRATTASILAAVFFGIALAGIGLGLQAQNRHAPPLAGFATGIATLFWLVHTIFFVQVLHSILLCALCGMLTLLFGALLALSIGAIREFRKSPPPAGLEVLPADYQVPYSHLHQDPPEVRLAKELEQRRQKLEVQQKELEMLEEKLRRKMSRGE